MDQTPSSALSSSSAVLVDSPPLDSGALAGAANGTIIWAALHSFLSDTDFVILQVKIVFSAISIIYLGAHGTLRRPPSAKPASKPKDARKEEDTFAQGLTPSDALLFPLLAGVVLVGLYYLIQYLNDPEIISKILRHYFSVVAVASLSAMYTDALQLLTNLVFPKYWLDRGGTLVQVVDNFNGKVRRFPDYDRGSGAQRLLESAPHPLPGRWSRLRLPESMGRTLWTVRWLLRKPWKVRLAAYGLGEETFDVKFNQVVAAALAAVTALAFYLTNSAWLSNLMGQAACYGTFLVMSPTTFTTGSLVLVAFFFYDIYMVFFTPYMITVASKLDVPIKLSFRSAGRASMLGLGDIVLPGIVICLALRYDHWLHYHRQTVLKPMKLKRDLKEGGTEREKGQPHLEDGVVKLKPVYRDIEGAWADWFWTWTWPWRSSNRRGTWKREVPTVAAASFKKTYFYAAIAGYTLGMIATLTVLVIFNHGQPALLYLVPGVLGSLWLTAWVRGEIGEMWMYTEDGSLDTQDVVVTTTYDGQVLKEVGVVKDKDGQVKQEFVLETAVEEKDLKIPSVTLVKPEDQKAGDAKKASAAAKSKKKKSSYVFLFSIEAPNSGQDGNESQDSDADAATLEE